MKLLGIEMSLEEFDTLMCQQAKGKELKVVDGKVVAVERVELPKTQEEIIEQLRIKRKPLLHAFDIYKSNVNYGIEEDANREKILKWYKAILNLDEKAISNPPDEIRRYM